MLFGKLQALDDVTPCFSRTNPDVKLLIKLVKILQELAGSEPKACPKHQRERSTDIC